MRLIHSETRCAGVSQLLVGHPFDTLKVKLQSGHGTAGPLSVAQQTLKQEGIRGLYRGMLLPLTTVAAFNAVLFSSKGFSNDMLQKRSGGPLTLQDHLVSSVFAGGVVSFVASPTELVKCRLQHQGTFESARLRLTAWERGGKRGDRPTLYRGPWDVLRDVYVNERGLRGCFNGLGATLLREMAGNFLMFGAYEWIKMRLAMWRGLGTTNDLGSADLMFAGGCGGTAFWLGLFPMDVVKSKLQVQRFDRRQYAGISDCFRQVLAAEGVAGLYRGFAPCLLRAFPANAVAFVAYEQTFRALQPNAL